MGGKGCGAVAVRCIHRPVRLTSGDCDDSRGQSGPSIDRAGFGLVQGVRRGNGPIFYGGREERLKNQ